VHENAPTGGSKGFRPSREETGDNSGKNITRTGGCQANIAEAAKTKLLLRLGYECSGPLQSHGGTEGQGCLTSEPLRIGLYLRPFAFEDPGHFSRVWRENDLLPMRFPHSGVTEGFQGDGIEHKGPTRFRPFENGLDQSIDCRLIEKPWSNQNAIRAIDQTQQLIDI